MLKISFISSNRREYNISRCLSLIKSEITSRLVSAKSVIIKPCCEFENAPNHTTSPEALSTVLDFISNIYSKQITLATKPAQGDIIDLFRSYDYLELQQKYDFAVLDLSKDNYLESEIILSSGKKSKIFLSSSLVESDLIINVAVAKTHPQIPLTGAMDNLLNGLLIEKNKTGLKLFSKPSQNNKIYETGKYCGENITTLSKFIGNSISIIDGFSVLQGNAETQSADTLSTYWALASSNAQAADWLMCRLLGIDIDLIPHLSESADIVNNETSLVVGDDWQKNIKNITLHKNFDNIRII